MWYTNFSLILLYPTIRVNASFARNFKAQYSLWVCFALKKVPAINLTVGICPMETTGVVVTGDFCPTTSNIACSNAQMLALTQTRGYSAMASCVIEHIVTNSELKESERLYYVLADLYANYERAKTGRRWITISGRIWERRLNLSEEYVFILQQALEAKGYFQITRNKIDNQNEINVITPTLPRAVFDELKLAANRHNAPSNGDENQARAFLDDTKMFVKFNNKQIESLIQNKELSPLQKLIWILLYMRSTCSFQASGDWRSSITQAELCSLFKCSTSAASKALSNLEKHGFINKHQSKLHAENSVSNRRKKSVWFIEALFPKTCMNTLLQQRIRTNLNLDCEYFAQGVQPVDNTQSFPTVGAQFSPRSGDISQGSAQISQTPVTSIKDITTKSYFNKNNNQQTYASSGVIDVVFETEQKMQKLVTHQDLTTNNVLDVDIVAEKNRRNCEKLTPEQVRKAVNFAKKLKREKLCAQALRDVDELELARQFIHHAANYKMTRLSFKTRDEEIEAALSFAWQAARTGQWRCPVGWGQAIDLHLEREKYRYEPSLSPQVARFERKIQQYLQA